MKHARRGARVWAPLRRAKGGVRRICAHSYGSTDFASLSPVSSSLVSPSFPDALGDFAPPQASQAQAPPSTTEGSAKPQKKAPKAFDPLGKSKKKAPKAFDPLGKKGQRQDAAGSGAGGSHGGGAGAGAPGLDVEEGTENLIDKLAEQFAGGLEDNGELQGMVDSVMRQLLSKEVLYEPLREISAKYPKWLEENEQQISREDFERYSKQLAAIRRLIDVYSKGSDFEDILELMQEIQACGQPPDEIIHELAPDLQPGADGQAPPQGGDPLQQLMGGMSSGLPDPSAGCPIQ